MSILKRNSTYLYEPFALEELQVMHVGFKAMTNSFIHYILSQTNLLLSFWCCYVNNHQLLLSQAKKHKTICNDNLQHTF